MDLIGFITVSIATITTRSIKVNARSKPGLGRLGIAVSDGQASALYVTPVFEETLKKVVEIALGKSAEVKITLANSVMGFLEKCADPCEVISATKP